MKRSIIVGGTIAAAAVVAGVGLALAGTGSGGNSYGGSSMTMPATSNGTAAGVQTAQTHLGQILVDSRGRTLYLFEKDTANMSSCNGSCASVWPPLTTTAMPRVTGGTQTNLVGTVRRSDGTMQVTYGGHALYFYVADSKAGDFKGQGLDQFGAQWDVVAPTGSAIDGDN